MGQLLGTPSRFDCISYGDASTNASGKLPRQNTDLTELDLASWGSTIALNSGRGAAKPIRERVLEEGWNSDKGTFVATLKGSGLEANPLLLHEIGIVSAHDKRFIALSKVSAKL